MVEAKTRPTLLLCLLFISYTSLSLARRALQDVYLLIPGFLGDEHATTRLGFPKFHIPLSVLFLSRTVSSNTLFWLILCTVNGLALGVSWPSVAKILRTYVPSRELATWWGVISASVNLAGGIGPWISLSLFTTLSMYFGEKRAWKLVLVTTGNGCVLSVVLLLLHFWSQRGLDGKKVTTNSDPLKSGLTLWNGPIHEVGDPQTSMNKGAKTTGIHTKAAHTDDNLQQELHSTAYDSSKPGITQQWCKLYHSLSPTQRTLLCCSATVHLASTFLRFAISNWFPIMLLKQKEEFGYGRSSSKI
ncbi:hypothetical protein FBUS_05200 [Fasciolopsis buskii]|uniref:Uncharacterized protein n=1 Tax=Fasciolopsis buskii TaxID=27845 RepID=A0A8E0RTF4_9TREM|nr:hypothetical protein FBUS_05200 [Fasciolopsis buski]